MFGRAAFPPSEVEIACDNRSSCKFCGSTLSKGTPRISVYEYNSYSDSPAKRYAKLGCAQRRGMKISDARLLKLIPASENPKLCDWTKKEIKYSKALYDKIEEVEKNLKPDVLQQILKENDIPIREKRKDLWARFVADGLLHGAMPQCPSCKTKALVFFGENWECSGSLSAVTQCRYKGNNPIVREPFYIPNALAGHKYFKDWKPAKGSLAQMRGSGGPPELDPNGDSGDEMDADVPEGKEMLGMAFGIAGSTGMPRKQLVALINEHGGEVTTVVDGMTYMITSEADVKKSKPAALLQKAKKASVPCLPLEFVQGLADRDLKLRQRKHQSDMRLHGDEGSRIPSVQALLKRKREPDDEGEGGETKSARVALGPIKPGSPLLKVHHFSGLVATGKIYVTEENIAFNVTLTQADIQTGVNKFYIIQIVHSGKSYTVFTHWGRVGDTSGVMSGGWGHKPSYQTKRFGSPNGAIKFFSEKFKKCTGNNWADHQSFQQLPGRYNMVELAGRMDEEEVEENAKKAKGKGKGKAKAKGKGKAKAAAEPAALDPRLKDFVKLIFDQEMMKRSMAEAGLDLKKMPLGSLSKRQMKAGYDCLKDVLAILDGKTSTLDAEHRQTLLSDATNRFYNAIPHSFSRFKTPPVISDMATLKRKLELMEQLLDIDVASKLIAETKDADHTDPDVANYEKLHCELEPVDDKSDELATIKAYVKNTHAATHRGYELEVLQVFKAKREGEEARYEDFKDLNNRRLLWHGSRLTNWVGILSQGLRIAPPEAPVSGYMFGKGVYFADMVSKSANYCATSKGNSTGVLLLCEVALGAQYELLHSEYSAGDSAKKNKKNSTWGIGKTHPAPAGAVTMPDGVQIPKGKGTSNPKAKGSSLLYNEFIVYDVSQIKMRYVIKMKFKYGAGGGFW